MIKFDPSENYVIVTCTECPNVWSAFAWDRIAAYNSGALHQVNTHNVDPSDAESALRLYLKRNKLTN